MIKQDLKIAIIQADLYWEDKAKNLERFSRIINDISGEQDIILLPEMFTTGFTMSPSTLAEPINGDTFKWMRLTASEKGFALGGSYIVQENGGFFNRFVFVLPSGDFFYYDKRHLFRMGKENEIYNKGKRRVVFEYLGWRIMLNICYDLRFPVWSRNRGDYDLLINAANFPAPRRDVWNTLLKARAIENQCYVAAVNRIGKDGMNISYTGDSQLVNPRGQVVASADQNQETIIYGSLNMNELVEFREKFPVLLDVDDFEIIS